MKEGRHRKHSDFIILTDRIIQLTLPNFLILQYAVKPLQKI